MIAETTRIPEMEHEPEKTRRLTSELSIEEEVITPEEAKVILRNVYPGKTVDKKAVSAYVDALRKGAWANNGTVIKFDYYGRLIDGLQRLNACVEANIPLRTLVGRGLSPDAIFTTDTHRQRNHVTILEAAGYSHASLLSPATGKLYRIENGKYGTGFPATRDELNVMIEANPLLQDAVQIAADYSSYILTAPAITILAFEALAAGHREKLIEFLERFNAFDENASIPSEGSNAPEVLRGKADSWHADSIQIVENKRRLMKAVSLDVVMGTAIMFFNAFLKGERVSQRQVFMPLDPPKSGETPKAPNLGLPNVTGYPGFKMAKVGEAREVESKNEKALILANKKADEEKREIVAGLFSITPDMAERWLKDDVNRGNRNVMKPHWETIARDIENERWVDSLDPINFTADPFDCDSGNPPRLLNGQHRLHAIRHSKKTLRIPLAWNIDEVAFTTFDNHKKGKIPTDNGESAADQRVLMAAARYIWKLESGYDIYKRPGVSASSMELLDVIERHPNLKTYAGLARTKNMRSFGSAGVVAYFMHSIMEEDPEAGQLLIDYMQAKEVPTEYLDAKGALSAFGRQMSAAPKAGTRGKSRSDVLSELRSKWKSVRQWYYKRKNELGRGTKSEQAKLEQAEELF